MTESEAPFKAGDKLRYIGGIQYSLLPESLTVLDLKEDGCWWVRFDGRPEAWYMAHAFRLAA
jgi:hypothetical protein